MELFKSAAAAACFLGLIFAAAENLLPSEKFSKQIHMLFSLIMIAAVGVKLSSEDFELPDISPGEASGGIYEQQYDDFLDKKIQENICGSLSEILINNNIYPVNISVNINNSADGSISIKKAVITLTDLSEISDAEKIVSEALGDDVDVDIVMEGNE